MKKTLFIAIYIILFSHLYAEKKIAVPFLPEKEIKINAVLEERDKWTGAYTTDLFFQVEPGENVLPSRKTSLKMFHNGKALYLWVLCFDPRPKEIKRERFRRDEVWDAERIEIGLDTYGNGKQMYVFLITPMNDVADGMFDLNINQASLEIDLNFISRTSITEQGWLLEIEIPFSTLNYPRQSQQLWGLFFRRYVPRQDMEVIALAPSVRASNNMLDEYVFLEMEDVSAVNNKKLALIPALFGEFSRHSAFNAQVTKETRLNAGLTGEYTPASSFNMKFTVNPDFSQVEADYVQSRVNRRYPVFYSEKRPFFLDGMDSFRTPFTLVHTRTIVDPQAGLKLSLKTTSFGFSYIGAYEHDVSSERFYNDFDEKRNALWNIGRAVISFKKGSQLAAMFGLRNYGNLQNSFFAVDGVNYIGKFYLSFQGIHTLTSYPSEDDKSGSGGYVYGTYKWNKFLSTYMRYSFLSPDFRADSGFFYRIDFKNLSSGITLNWLPQKSEGLFKRISLAVDYSLTRNYQHKKINEGPSVDLSIDFPQRITFFSFIKKDQEEYSGGIFNVTSNSFFLKWSRFEFFSPSASFSFGRSVVYNQENPREANNMSFTAGLSSSMKSVSPSVQILYDRLVELEDGGLISRQISIQGQLNWFLASRLNLRLMIQREIFRLNDFQLEIPYTFLNFLFSYDHSAFSKIYFGVTNKHSDYNYFQNDARYWRKEWIVFFKIQHIIAI